MVYFQSKMKLVMKKLKWCRPWDLCDRIENNSLAATTLLLSHEFLFIENCIVS